MVLDDSPPRRGFRPSSAVLFESAADVYGPTMAALLFRGDCEDALLGLCSVRLGGGRVLAHRYERRGAGSVLSELTVGLADAVLPVEQLASQLLEVCRALPDATPARCENGKLKLAS